MKLSKLFLGILKESQIELASIKDPEKENERITMAHYSISEKDVNEIIEIIDKLEDELEQKNKWYKEERDKVSEYLRYKIAFGALVKELSK